MEGFHPGVFRGVCLIGFCDFFARVPPRGMGGANFARLSEFSEVPGKEEGGDSLLILRDVVVGRQNRWASVTGGRGADARRPVACGGLEPGEVTLRAQHRAEHI